MPTHRACIWSSIPLLSGALTLGAVLACCGSAANASDFGARGPAVGGAPAVAPPAAPAPGTAPVAAPAPAEAPVRRSRLGQLLASARKHFISAHRGDYRANEGNNMTALRRAARAGVDFIEVDVETTQDGVPVIAHDPWPRKRTMAGWRRARRAPLTLAHVLRWSASMHHPILILDLKSPSLEGIVRVLLAHRTAGRVLLYASDEAEFHRVRFLAPAFDVMVRARNSEEARVWLRRKDPRIAMIHGDYEWLIPQVVQELHAAGARLFVNSYRLVWHDETLGAKDSVQRVFRRGIDVAQTNNPPSAVATCRRANR